MGPTQRQMLHEVHLQMTPRKLLPFLLSLSLLAFVGAPVLAAHAKSKSQSQDDDKKNGQDNGKKNGQDKHDDHAAGPSNDFALFDGSNPLNQPAAGAICGAPKGQPFTYHLAAANYGGDGFLRVTYADGDWVQYPIAARASFSLSQAAGSAGGADSIVRVSNGGSAAQLAGVLSAENAKCASCDADGGIGDAGCDAKLPN